MKLKVKVIHKHVPNYPAQEQGANRFLGCGEELSIDSRPEYIQHLRQGDLEALDQLTASHAGVKLSVAETPKETK